jgi:hypothetical protein
MPVNGLIYRACNEVQLTVANACLMPGLQILVQPLHLVEYSTRCLRKVTLELRCDDVNIKTRPYFELLRGHKA